MSKQDEAFEKWQAHHTQLGYYPTQYDAAKVAFAAGREAEQKRILELIADLTDVFAPLGTMTKQFSAQIARRIKEQEEVQDGIRAESITCPICKMTSFNLNDVNFKYCGNCHKFHDQMI